jgi:hypothetical protein
MAFVPSRTIRRRDDWADMTTPPPPSGALEAEEPRFLLVHHTASSNAYEREAVPEILRGIYRWHRHQDWPDVAYNFFVDRYGACWEGRAGSMAGPVRADATGGSQGFAQLVCLIGNFEEAPPSAAAVDTLVETLAWLAQRDHIDVTAGATAEFVSRGSNLWPAGHAVRMRTIAGHREVSRTLCPGEHLFRLLDDEIPSRVRGHPLLVG